MCWEAGRWEVGLKSKAESRKQRDIAGQGENGRLGNAMTPCTKSHTLYNFYVQKKKKVHLCCYSASHVSSSFVLLLFLLLNSALFSYSQRCLSDKMKKEMPAKIILSVCVFLCLGVAGESGTLATLPWRSGVHIVGDSADLQVSRPHPAHPGQHHR